MTRDEIYSEMEALFGIVPAPFSRMPDDVLDLEWALWKKARLSETSIPPVFRELIGLACAAIAGNDYGCELHSDMAKMHGATEQQIEEAARIARAEGGWHAYNMALRLSGHQLTLEPREIAGHLRAALREEERASM